MHVQITRLLPDVFRLEIPFEDIYTAVFLLRTDEGDILIDAATTDRDAEEYILPALRSFEPAAIPRALLLTHGHGDHAGGAPRLAREFPHMSVFAHEEIKGLPCHTVADGELLFGRLRVLHLPGHTRRSVGYLDEKSDSLFSGDCLQLRGVGRYRNGVGYPDLYLQSIHLLSQLAPTRIFASHEYDPLGSVAQGSQEVTRYLEECVASCPRFRKG